MSVVPWTEQHARVRDVDLEAAAEQQSGKPFFFFFSMISLLSCPRYLFHPLLAPFGKQK